MSKLESLPEGDIFAEMATDVQKLPETDQLGEVSRLAEEQIAAAAEVARLEEELSQAKRNHAEIAEKKLPEAMAAVHLREFKLTNGAKITVKPYYTAKIDDDNRDQCHSWLVKHGHGDLIKHQIHVPLGRGDDHIARVLVDWLKENNIDFTDKEGVHWQTLVAFVREQVENGRDLDLELFRVFIGQKAKVTFPKA